MHIIVESEGWALNLDRLQALLHSLDDILVSADIVVSSEFLKLSSHDQEPDSEEVDSLETQGTLFVIFLPVVSKFRCHFGPVHLAVGVMYNVVTIVKNFVVV